MCWVYNMEKNPIIRVTNLTTKYEQRTILENIQFEVLSGEIFMIVGVSGCGKTTLLNNLIGLLEPFSGDIFIDGDNFFRSSEKQQAQILKKVGVLYQQSALFGSINLLDNVKLPLQELTTLPADAIHWIANNKLKMVGLDGFGDYMPVELSGGMQKRAAIARAMALDPKILFLDEPSSGLDPIVSAEIDQLIMNLSNALKITFVIISHSLSSINKIGQRVILLHQGRIIAEGTPAALQNHSNDLVRSFFNQGHLVHDNEKLRK